MNYSNRNIERLDKRIASKIDDGDLLVELSPIIKNNLKFTPRPYQEEAFTALNYYLNNPRLRLKPTQVLFHMATGRRGASGEERRSWSEHDEGGKLRWSSARTGP